LNCGIARRAYRAENQQNLIAFDQFSRLFDRLGWAIGVIVGDEVDLAPIDAAFRVDLLEIGVLNFSEYAKGRGGSAVRRNIPDLDLRVRDAWTVVPVGNLIRLASEAESRNVSGL
jgi:hypothetical protein